MKSLAYWIQRADFSATDHEPTDVATALRAFDAHPWHDELNLQSELENGGREYCPPGIGFVDPHEVFDARRSVEHALFDGGYRHADVTVRSADDGRGNKEGGEGRGGGRFGEPAGFVEVRGSVAP